MSCIKAIIDKWDPIDLFPCSPNDEYHSEISEIERLFNKTNDIEELGEGVYSVFLNSFGKDVFQKTRFECTEIARYILLERQKRG